MADVFCEHGAASDGTGASWDSPRNDLFTAVASLSTGDNLRIKSHAGVLATATGINPSVSCGIHGGYSAALIGTETGSAYQTGHTVLDGTPLIGKTTSTNRGLRLVSIGAVAVSHIWVKNFINSGTLSGAGSIVLGVTATFTRVGFSGNSSGGNGGGCALDTGGADFNDCLFLGNEAKGSQGGGAVWVNTNRIASLRGCTIADNTTTASVVGGVRFAHADSQLDNCILWGNRGSSGTVQVSNSAASSANYCDIENITGDGLDGSITAGAGCVSIDPEFLGLGDHPYELSSSTPSTVTAGGSDGITGYTGIDFLGETRSSPPSMGAYEYVITETGDTVTTYSENETTGSFLDAVTVVDSFTASSDNETIGSFSDVVQTGDTVQSVSETEIAGSFLDTITILDDIAGIADTEVTGSFVDAVATLDTVTGTQEVITLGTFYDDADSGDNVTSYTDTELFGSFVDSITIVDTLVGSTELEVVGTFDDTQAVLDDIATITETEALGFFLDSVTTTDNILQAIDVCLSGSFNDSVGTASDTVDGILDNESLGSFEDYTTTSDIVVAVTESTQAGSFVDDVPIIDSVLAAVDSVTVGSYSDIVGSLITVNITSPIQLFSEIASVSVVNTGMTAFQKLIFIDDHINNFLNVSEFGINIQYYHSSLDLWTSYAVVFDDPHTSQDVGDFGSVSQVQPQIELCEALLKHRVLKGDKFVKSGTTYFVEDSKKDGVGSVVVYGKAR